MPWKCHFLWMWNRAGFLPDIAALGCCDWAWSIHPHWMKLCVSPVLFLPFYLVVCKSKLPTSNVQGIRQSWDRDTGKVGGKQSEELCLWVTLGSKIMSLAWSCCQRHFNVFGQDQEILRAVSVHGLPRSLERSFSASGKAATSQWEWGVRLKEVIGTKKTEFTRELET